MAVEKIEHQKLLQQLLSLLIKYQNAGKGDVFYHLSGHVSKLDFDVYVGSWDGYKKPEISGNISSDTALKDAIEDIRHLFDNTPSVIEVEAKAAAQKEERERKRYEELKAKFE